MTKDLQIKTLRSGGLITNYYCSSRCRHCLYGSSPKWEKKYVDDAQARQIFKKIRSLGCSSIHIGGGEPFLKISQLLSTVRIAREEGLTIEYIETNSSWFRDDESTCSILKDFKASGVDTLLLSISPFHNEYIAFNKVKGLINSCREAGMNVFPWVRDFYPDINSMDDSKPHGLAEYCKKFGEDYMTEVHHRYGLNLRGRALMTYKDMYPKRSLKDILHSTSGCKELSGVSHFHIDLFGGYIPGLCSGFSIRLEDLGQTISREKYPLITTLYNEGIGGLLTLAREEYSFVPKEEYFSKCDLCYDIRNFLVIEKKVDSPELQPTEFYYQL